MASPARPIPGLHVAIVMDGNGRWAARRGLPRAAGHRAGVEAVRRVVRAAPGLGIGVLTLYAFSADNWRRPETEVRALFVLLREYLDGAAAECVTNGVRMRVIGRRDRLPIRLRGAIDRAEAVTAPGVTLELRVALDYSAREAIVHAAREAAAAARGAGGPAAAAAAGEAADPGAGGGSAPLDCERFAARIAEACHAGAEPRDVDLLVRAGGEQRLSDFLLWECAYAELYFTPVLWPDFDAAHLAAAVREFHRRERRFGALPGAPDPAAGAARAS
jgi:undecaprenyl diphosphate synthase